MSEQIYSDMVRKTGKLFRLGVLFRQIVQTWRENQAHSELVQARTAYLARNSVHSQRFRTRNPVSTRSKYRVEIALRPAPARVPLHAPLTCDVAAPARAVDLRICRRCTQRGPAALREQELPDASGNTFSVQAKVRKQHVARSGGAKGTHASKAHGRGQLLGQKLSNRSSKAR